MSDTSTKNLTDTPVKPLTGRKVLIITLLAFGTVITANLSLVYFAIGTFPGLEVKNTYVASQQFEASKIAQDALGWTVGVTYENDVLALNIDTSDGQPAQIKSLTASVGRATYANEDRQVFFKTVGRGYVAATSLSAGNWQLRLNAVSADGTAFWQHIPLIVGQ